MRIRSPRTKPETAPPAAEEAVVAAVDAALGFIAGQQWVRRQTAVAVLEAVRDAARKVDTPQRLYEFIDVALDDCHQDRTLAAPLTDALLDIRNSSRRRQEAISPTAMRQRLG
jgi:hypothetical protein